MVPTDHDGHFRALAMRTVTLVQMLEEMRTQSNEASVQIISGKKLMDQLNASH